MTPNPDILTMIPKDPYNIDKVWLHVWGRYLSSMQSLICLPQGGL